MYFFTADEHYGHDNIIGYCQRPFQNADEMDEALIYNHNQLVTKEDVTVHVGDFTLMTRKAEVYEKYIKRLNGTHIFIKGSHDWWLPKSHMKRWEREIEGQYVIADHYAMRTWRFSHYNSWQVFGHSHGKLKPIGKQWDVGVDNNYFFPVSWARLNQIMDGLDDNPNLLHDRNYATIQILRKRGG